MIKKIRWKVVLLGGSALCTNGSAGNLMQLSVTRSALISFYLRGLAFSSVGGPKFTKSRC